LKKTILIVFGTRPEAIKLAILISILRQANAINCVVCATGQQREMLDQVVSAFSIHCDHDLDVMTQDQPLGKMTAKIIDKLDEVYASVRPDLIVVHGDTTTSFAASLAAFYRGVRVVHVEAGLRTHNILAPWPEEANRKLICVLTDYHFTPTLQSKDNLVNEGVPEDKILVTGNTVVDALVFMRSSLRTTASKMELEKKFHFLNSNRKLLLLTGHRRESFGEGFENICQAVSQLASRPDVQVVYPVHLNPNVSGPVRRILGKHESIFLIPPVDYVSFIYLMERCYFILTDSGGIQEEAPSFGKPVLVLRDVTERPECVENGFAVLCGCDTKRIIDAATTLLDSDDAYNAMVPKFNPFGDGQASSRIANKILELL